MKCIRVIVFVVLLLGMPALPVSGQRRPVRKPATIAPTKPAVTASPTPKASSPAEAFFNEGSKCDAKDYDCQVSNFTKAINLNLNTKAVYQKRAAAFMGREEFEKAISDLTKVIELDLNDATGFKGRGKAYLGMPRSSQNIQNAIKDFTSAIDLEPKDAETYGLRGSAYLFFRSTEKANADFGRSMLLEPSNVSLHLKRGLAYFAVSDFEKAIEAYSKAIILEPRSADALESRSAAYLRQGKADMAIQDIRRAIEIDPGRSKLLVDIGEMLEGQNKYDDAIKLYENMIVSDPKSALGFYKRASVQVLKQNYAEAIPGLNKSIEIDPQFAKAYEARCQSQYHLAIYRDALNDCTQAIKLAPDLEDAYLIRATLLRLTMGATADQVKQQSNRGNLNRIANANRRLEGNPHAYDALLKRAYGYQGIGEYSKSIVDFSAAIMIRPDSAEAYAGRGTSHSSLRDVNRAESDYAKAVELDPKSSAYFDVLATLRGTGAEVRIQTFPNHYWGYFMRAGTQYSNKNFNYAITDLNTALKLLDTEKSRTFKEQIIPVIMAELARNYHALKDDTKAISILSRAIEMYPESPRAYLGRATAIEAMAVNLHFSNSSPSAKATAKQYLLQAKSDYFSLCQIVDLTECSLAIMKMEQISKLGLGSEITPEIEQLKINELRARLQDQSLKVDQYLKLSGGTGVIDPTATIENSQRANDRAKFEESLRKDSEERRLKAEEALAENIRRGNVEIESKMQEAIEKGQRRAENYKTAGTIIGSTLGTVIQTTQKPPVGTSATPSQSGQSLARQTTTSPNNPSSSGAGSSGSNSDDCPTDTNFGPSTNTGEVEPGTQQAYGWSAWQSHPGYRGLLIRTRLQYRQKGQSYWYWEMEIKNNYTEQVSVQAFTSDKCKMKNTEINELYSDGSNVVIASGGTGRETHLRSASSAQVKFWVTMYRKSGNGKIARHDDGSLPLKCQIYPSGQSCPDQP